MRRAVTERAREEVAKSERDAQIRAELTAAESERKRLAICSANLEKGRSALMRAASASKTYTPDKSDRLAEQFASLDLMETV